MDSVGHEVNDALVHPHLSARHQPDGLGQRHRRIVLQKDARRAQLQGDGRFRRIHSGGDHQDLSRVAGPAGRRDELAAVILAEIEIQEDDIDRRAFQNLQGLGGRAAVAHHLEVGLRSQKAAQALSKQNVIIEQQQPDCVPCLPVRP